MSQFKSLLNKNDFLKNFESFERDLIITFFNKLDFFFSNDGNNNDFSKTCYFVFGSNITIDKSVPDLFLKHKCSEHIFETAILSPAEFSLKLDKIEFVFLDLLQDFNALINNDKFYKIKEDKLLLLNLYNNLLRFQHPFFLQISNYFDYISNIRKNMSFKIFDLSVFLEILVFIHLRSFDIYIFQKKKHVFTRYNVTIELPVLDLDDRFNPKESS